MKQTQSKETIWLSLSEAADHLNIHPATLRRWADEGQIPVMRTPGGHRRFAASDLVRLTDREGSDLMLGPVERIWAERAMKNTRDRLMAARDDVWLGRLDEESKNAYRRLGQELLEQTLRYLMNEDTETRMKKDARTIGRQYAELAVRNHLSLSEVLRAFMLFRDSLVATAIELPEDMSIPPASQKFLMDRISLMLNTVQLGVAEVYDNYMR
jgi:excisionase family DNA binding protein